MIMSRSIYPHVLDVKTTFSNEVDISGMIPLHPSFEPTNNDVICARGKEVYNHEGNRRFRALVKSYLPTYSTCVTKMQKTRLVADIIETVRTASVHGGFVKNVKGKWYEVGDRRAKEKTGQTMRDLLHTRYSSSTKAKARARRQLREEYQMQSKEGDEPMQQEKQPRSLDSSFSPLPRSDRLSTQNQSISDRQIGEIQRNIESINARNFKFPMADQVFGFEEDQQTKETLDLDPLPLEQSIISVDFDDAKLLSEGIVSDDSFRAAIDSLFSSLQPSG